MSFKNAKVLMATMLIMCYPIAGMAELVQVDQAVEAYSFQFANGKPVGQIIARECAKCPDMYITTTAKTQAIRDGRAVSLSEVPGFSKAFVTVIYDPKTMVANKILW